MKMLTATNKKPASASILDKGVPSRARPEDDLVDLAPLAEMLRALRDKNQEYQRIVEVLGAARRLEKGWDVVPEIEPVLSVRREILALSGDDAVLARFDEEQGAALAAEQEARQRATQQALELPTRIKALETYARELAQRMVSETDEGRMHEEVERLFVPSAQRMVAATETFVQTWREMRTVERVFATVLNIAHQSVYGDHYQMRYECELVGERHQGQLLPSLIHGVEFDVVDKLNRGFDDLDDDLLQRLWSKLNEAGIERHNLKVIHPGSENDRRNIYAPEGKGPAKRPEYVHGGHVQIV